MVYFNDNPKLGFECIRTLHGDIEYVQNCVKFPDGFYVKGIDLMENDGKWSKVEKVFCHKLKKDVDYSRELKYGVVSFNENGEAVKGFFTENLYTNCRIYNPITSASTPCIDYSILPKDKFIEKLSDGYYLSTAELAPLQIKLLSQKTLTINNSGRAYNIEDVPKEYTRLKDLYANSTFPIDKDLRQLARYLGDNSFGVELETINGTLPPHILNKYGINICKDGSIKNAAGLYPPEYVTVPLQGAKGLQTLRNMSQEIAKRSDINVQCSYHLHLGGFKIDRVLMVSLYVLASKIQKDVFKMFPAYKIRWENFKKQNYCQKLPNIVSKFGTKNFNNYINNTYADLYGFLSGGRGFSPEVNRKKKIDPWGGAKWNNLTRYYWINLTNPLYGKRDTIEFRIHTPTLNPDKIINWLFMCVAIIKFAETNIVQSLGKDDITFEQVLQWYGNFHKTPEAICLSNNLIKYYKNRVDYFAKDLERGDLLSPKELIDDPNFKFPLTITE